MTSYRKKETTSKKNVTTMKRSLMRNTGDERLTSSRKNADRYSVREKHRRNKHHYRTCMTTNSMKRTTKKMMMNMSRMRTTAEL